VSLRILALLLLLASRTFAGPIILDTDIGDDIDDTWALAMALGRPEVDLKLIVTASDDTPSKTRLLAKILEHVGRTDIPIGTGKKNSDRPLNQAKWLGDYDIKNYAGVVHTDGIQAMIDFIKESKEEVTLLVIGPQTNIAEALARDPSIAKNARVVSMAGSVEIGYNGKQGRDPEWNVFRDIVSARAVFAAPWKIILTPLDSCGTLILSGERYKRVAESKTPLAGVVMDNYRDWTNRANYPADASSVLFDTVAVYLAWDTSLCEMNTVKLTIDDKGATVPDDTGRPVECAMGWKNRDGFEALLVEALTRK
jgi:inosine-uridine nucleoside N-ribohydrolase